MTLITDTQVSPVDMQSRRDVALSPGDTVRVHQKIAEKDKVRIQVFEGVVIAHKHGTEPGATFTVRRSGSDGIAVEKIFPLYSPMIDRIEIVRRTKMRRSRLYFLREKTPKQIREKLRRTKMVSEGTMSEQQREKGGEVGVDTGKTQDETTQNESGVVDAGNTQDEVGVDAEKAQDETTQGGEQQKEKPDEDKGQV